uniref:WD_REPEATS_REGION domain-containing protein n=1 Tax=Angiostrongylus cantonensis TaxID=6313 RepID=A0A0K0D911_ANGCA
MKDVAYDHVWSVTTLKGHTAEVTGIDFAQDGKKFVSVSTDRSAFLWDVRFDTATKVSFSPDCKSMVFAMKRMNKVVIYFCSDVFDGDFRKHYQLLNVSFPVAHTVDISHCGISSTGKFLMSASQDMKIVLYDIHGSILKVLEPKLSSLFDVALSPDGRFGHNSGVFAVAFNSNSTRTVTVSRDGYWRVFDTDIRYTQGQEAIVLNKGEWSMLKGASADHIRLAVSPSGGSFAVTCGSNLKLFSSEDASKDFPMFHVIRFSPCGRLVATCGDRYIRIFRNIAEYHSEVVRLYKNYDVVLLEV